MQANGGVGAIQDKDVLNYLKKKGYKQAEAAFKQEAKVATGIILLTNKIQQNNINYKGLNFSFIFI